MHKRLFILFFLILMLSDLFSQCSSTITSFPYVEDFETSAAWTTGGPANSIGAVLNDWTWGSPTKPVISGAGSGIKCWVIGGLTNSRYTDGERSYVMSPCFDFSSIVRPYVQFKIFWESEWKYDGTNLQYSLNGSNTWVNVGTSTDVVDCMNDNWYNRDPITNIGSYSNGGVNYASVSTVKEGWSGNVQSTQGGCQGGNGSGHWVTAKHCMKNLAGQANVRFRFTFGAGTSCNNFDGMAFDSVAIGEGTPNTASISSSCVSTAAIRFTGSTNLCADTFQWSFGDPASGASNTVANAINANHTFSAPGTYTVTLRVKGGPCNAPATATKTVHILGVNPVVTAVSCRGGNDGSVIAVMTGGASPYTYAWNTTPAQSGDTATGLTQGTYHVTVTSANACSVTATATVTQPTALSHSAASSPTICTASNGRAVVTESGGTPPYTYLWSNSLGTKDSIHNVTQGSYVLTVTDAHGCIDTVQVTIANTGSITASIANTTNVGCHGQSTGSITVSAANGATPYTYHWSATDSTVSNVHNGLAAAAYQITVNDIYGCVTTVRDTITQPTALVHTYTLTQTACGSSNGSVVVTETGGTPAYSYVWSGGLGTTDSIHNVGAGSYSLTITDAHACRDSVQVFISNTGGVTATAGPGTGTTCPGGSDGSISINASNGTAPYTYHWSATDSGSSNVKNGLRGGSYIVTVTDNNGCIDTVSTTVHQPPAFSHTVITIPNSCIQNNGYALVTEAGGSTAYSYVWSNGLGSADSFNTAGAGTYTLTITDANSCVDTAIVTITSAPILAAVIDSSINVSCPAGSDGRIVISASGGSPAYSYHWGASTTTLNSQSGFAAGIYVLTVSDTRGCSVTLTDTITEPAPIFVAPIDTNARCPGGSDGAIGLMVSGGTAGYSYHWNGTTQTTRVVTGLSANTYQVTVTDSRGCQKDTFTSLTSPPAFSIQKNTTTDSCSYGINATANIVVSGASPGYTYLWSNGATSANISGLAVGTYRISVTDNLLCQTIDSVSITSPPAITIAVAITDVSCHNDSNGTIAITAGGGTAGYTYLWNNAATTSTISSLHAGLYSLVVTDAYGCTASDPAITVQNPAALSAAVITIPQSCPSHSDGSATLIVSGGTRVYSYLWAGSQTDSAVSGIIAGTYYCTITDAHGCTLTDSAIVSIAPPLAVNATIAQPTCPPYANGSINLAPSGGSPAYSYTWSDGSTTASLLHLAPGSYPLTVTDSRQCVSLDTFTLAYPNPISVDAGPDDTIDLGNATQLTATVTGSSNVSYLWSPDYHLSCMNCQSTSAAPYQTITYILTVTDASGCKAFDSVTVFVNRVHDIYIPNAFTPNGDGQNDFFEIYGNNPAWKYVHASIYNRWGELLFESDDQHFRWDGTFKGSIQEPGIYVYLIDVTYIDGYHMSDLRGSLTLIR